MGGGGVLSFTPIKRGRGLEKYGSASFEVFLMRRVLARRVLVML